MFKTQKKPFVNKRNPENYLKGRMAETIIQEMLLKLEFNVYPFGMENTVPDIMRDLKGAKNECAMLIRKMPDFVVKHPTMDEPFFVEVKFKSNGCFSYKDLGKNYPYENVLVIVVSKRHIKSLTVEELKAGKEITEKSQNYLGKSFDKKYKDIVIEFCDYAARYLDTE